MRKRHIFWFSLIFISLLSLFLRLSLKNRQVNLDFLGNVIKGQGAARFIFFQMRLPAVLVAIAVSLLMNMATFILQAISKNELAEPSALYFSNVASESLAFLSLYFPLTVRLLYTILIFLSASIVLGFAYLKHRLTMTTEGVNGSLLLLGIGVNTLFQMVITYIRTYSSEANEILSLMMRGNFDHLSLLSSSRNCKEILEKRSSLFYTIFP